MPIIPWSVFTKETDEYVNKLADSIKNEGVSPSQYVKFDIDPLVEYLLDLRAHGNTSIDVHLSVTTQDAAKKVGVIFTADGATEKDPHGTSAFDVGNAWP